MGEKRLKLDRDRRGISHVFQSPDQEGLEQETDPGC